MAIAADTRQDANRTYMYVSDRKPHQIRLQAALSSLFSSRCPREFLSVIQMA